MKKIVVIIMTAIMLTGCVVIEDQGRDDYDDVLAELAAYEVMWDISMGADFEFAYAWALQQHDDVDEEKMCEYLEELFDEKTEYIMGE